MSRREPPKVSHPSTKLNTASLKLIIRVSIIALEFTICVWWLFLFWFIVNCFKFIFILSVACGPEDDKCQHPVLIREEHEIVTWKMAMTGCDQVKIHCAMNYNTLIILI